MLKLGGVRYIWEGDQRQEIDTALQKGEVKRKDAKELEAVIGLHANGVPVPIIAKSLK